MRNRVTTLLIVAGLALTGWSVAQDPTEPEPPLRLKKKVRPTDAQAPEGTPKTEPMPPLPMPGKTAPQDKEKAPEKEKSKEGTRPMPEPGEPEMEQPEVDEKEVLQRIDRNMRLSEDRLANRELSDGTRQVQEDILNDLDLLIKATENGGGGGGGGDDQQQQQQQQQGEQGGQQKQGQGGGGGQPRVKLGMGQQKSGSKQGRQQAGRGKQGRQQARGPQGGQPGPMPPQANPEGQPQQDQQANGAQAGGGGGRTEGEMNKLSEVYKDVWGHLPETLRQEMNAYSREQFMAKYNDLIRQYYTTIAEKGRRRP